MTLPPSPRKWLGQRWRRLAERRDAGSSTVELAILTPLLVGLLLFVVFCGRLVSAQLDLDAAAHGAARAASSPARYPVPTPTHGAPRWTPSPQGASPAGSQRSRSTPAGCVLAGWSG